MSLTLLALAIGLAVAPQETAPRGEPCALPAALRQALQGRFGSSRVLTAADLYEDERALFRADHPGACPGLATGRFFGPRERPAIALVLLDVGPDKAVRLIVARPAMATWTLLEVDELRQGATPVVWSETSARSRAAKPGSDLVILSAYDAWKRGYSWNGRSFERTEPRE
jgi:hypothetical protein